MAKFSIILPVRNAEKTLRQALEAIFASSLRDFEVIVINDASTDGSAQIAREFPCKVIGPDQCRGPACGRQQGLREASADIVVFIDADVLVAPDTFFKLAGHFEEHPDAVAIVGMLSKTHPNLDFFSIYKNLYMHYIFSRCPANIDFIYGSFFAIRRTFGAVVPENRFYGEDTELGLRLAQQGHLILLCKELEVVHLKKYSALSFIRNDFRVPFYWARLFLREKSWNQLARKKRFCHSNSAQLFSVGLAPVIILSLFFYPPVAFILLIAQMVINWPFFLFLGREKGISFACSSVVVTLFDFWVMSAGILAGFLSSLVRKARG